MYTEMGHSSIRTTFDNYGQMFPDEGGDVASSLEDLILGGNKVVAEGVGSGAALCQPCHVTGSRQCSWYALARAALAALGVELIVEAAA